MNKKFFFRAGVITFIILILVIILSPKKNVGKNISSPSSTPSTRTELVDLSQEKRNQAMIYVAAIEGKLPLYLASYKTSVGITTSINLYRLDRDPAEIVRLEIYGLSYLNKNELDEQKNPNVTAFKESYLKALDMLESQNIDPSKLIFIYGDKSYVKETSAYWVDMLKL